MQAMVLERPGTPLQARDIPTPRPGQGQILIRVLACGVCRTDLHIVDGELPNPALPLVPGHEIVGEVVSRGAGAERWPVGARVGVPWLGRTCGDCEYCRSGRENLCVRAEFTGYTLPGGYAEYTVVDERFCYACPPDQDAAETAPLLCAGLIGHRALRRTGDARRLGIYGFGAAGHLVAQIARFEGRAVFAFTRPGDRAAQQLAVELGATWAGDSTELPPEPLDAAIIFAPVGSLVPQALRAVGPGGIVVCAGIHMSDIPSFPYELLWRERSICSIANLTRRDGDELMALAPRAGVKTVVQTFPLSAANEALDGLRAGQLRGAGAVLLMSPQT
ncbi:MAG TPA: zinc-dependent alcohol dehydrogenase family protein [Vicinamibacterales bacterium]